MDNQALVNGLLMWLAFVGLTVFHEYAHAWTAVRCGDDTPRLQGRLTLDPLAHIDWLGTVLFPLFFVAITASGGGSMMFGWGRPVQVNLNNFLHRRFDDILVSGARPAMNLVLAIVILVVAKIVEVCGGSDHLEPLFRIARLSLILCFFNLVPVPPLDGGHIMRNLVGMSDEAYMMMSQYSFIFLLIILNSSQVLALVWGFANTTLSLLAWPFQFGWYFG